jgi:hypothetical protein
MARGLAILHDRGAARSWSVQLGFSLTQTVFASAGGLQAQPRHTSRAPRVTVAPDHGTSGSAGDCSPVNAGRGTMCPITPPPGQICTAINNRPC